MSFIPDPSQTSLIRGRGNENKSESENPIVALLEGRLYRKPYMKEGESGNT